MHSLNPRTSLYNAWRISREREWVEMADKLRRSDAKLDAVRETLNTPSVMDIGFMLDKLREIVK